MKEWKKIRSGLKWKNIFVLTLAGCINAFGVTIFLMPVKLYDSGISGTSMLLSQITPSWLSLPVFLIFLNIPLFLYGLKKQGPVFSIYAIYAVTIYSLGAWIITDILPVSVSEVSPLAGSDLLVSGLGSGLTIRYGGAMDGVEVLAIIFAKKWGMTVGTFVMLYNIVLYICCGIAIHSWTLPLYSIVTYAAALKTIDFVVEGIDRSKAAFIVTTRPETICEQLSEEFSCGMTIIDAKGYYSDEEKTVVYLVINRFQVGRMKEIIHELDKRAYISISEIADVYRYNQSKKSEKR